MKKLTFFLLFYSSLSCAGTKEYVVGSGSEFKFISENGEKVSLSIYVTQSSFTKLGIEYYFTTAGFMGVEAWQQYIMGISDTGLSLDEGYVQSPEMKHPEIMTKAFRENNENGVVVEDFFFSNLAEIDKYKIGIESAEVPAGNIQSTHYRKTRAEQTVDFWISDKAGAIGLVKLVSTGLKDKNQNYRIELMSLLKKVKTKINPKDAVPLTDKGKMFLGKNVK